ncbi:HicA toxin of toxin-antitoxin [Desulfonatronum thiosulfatophilum]|uniref:HicA toxin of toxin-antitoxin n=1 Tax=Desulfonatronum thiosulfatophilum TaxID=617002 RepID=A0A1G6ALE8_9BACT|nr:type II toxin-antitoxin system HicA family toxin [Desulfonatronum thiosulfatophilum]SDB08953.1 HicA toxin of toxin-antitoxin [Desulfonatronum thiosulfatophilum]
MNSKHRKTLEAIRADPVNGNIDWSRIEALLAALGCRIVEGAGSSVTFEREGHRATFHRPHPGREALRYRIKAVREYLDRLEVES